jgi:hypothetical protein
MTQVIHKHLLIWDKAVTLLALQPDAVLIDVGRDTRESDKIALWFIVDDARQATVVRTFHIVGTGHPVPTGVKHVGSVLMPPFKWHVFEENR